MLTAAALETRTARSSGAATEAMWAGGKVALLAEMMAEAMEQMMACVRAAYLVDARADWLAASTALDWVDKKVVRWGCRPAAEKAHRQVARWDAGMVDEMDGRTAAPSDTSLATTSGDTRDYTMVATWDDSAVAR